MINALPLFPAPIESPFHLNDQSGGIGLDQPQISEKPSGNPFSKILQDQPAWFFPLATLPLNIPPKNPENLSAPNDQIGLLDFALQELVDQDRPEGFYPENSLAHVELPLVASPLVELPVTVAVQPNPYPVAVPENEVQTFHEREDFVQKFSYPLPSLSGYEIDGGNKTEQIPELMRPSPGGLLVNGPLPRAVLYSQVPNVEGLAAGEAPVGRTRGNNSLAPITPIMTYPDRRPLPGDGLKDHGQLRKIFNEDPAPEPGIETEKIGEKPPERLTRPVQVLANLALRIPSTATRISPMPYNPAINQAFQSPIPFQEIPASLAEIVQSNLTRMKTVNGLSSLLSETSMNGKESSVIPSDFLREFSVSSTGDRSKDIPEFAGKVVGVDSSGGQGINNGMGGSSPHQPGFQHSQSSIPSGANARSAEERVPDFPAPALQRLQMDVQVSENNRIQIDVGIQQRQVYAGLLMDQGTLKNLAVQFVPQLENQLAKVDMDLQEFSAEVRDHGPERESDNASHRPGMSSHQESHSIIHPTHESLSGYLKHVGDQGLHLVA